MLCWCADVVRCVQLLGWPKEYVGPVLNLVRVFVLHPHAAETYSKEIVEEKRAEEGQTALHKSCRAASGSVCLHAVTHRERLSLCNLCCCPCWCGADMVSILLNLLSSTDKAVTSMLAIRVLCNFFSRRVLSRAMGARYESIFDTLAASLQRFQDDNLRASAFALYINYTLLFCENSALYEAGKVQLLSSLPEQLRLDALNAKLVYRLLVVLGTLLYEDSNTVEMALALEVPAVVAEVGKEHQQDQQVKQVVSEIEQVLSVKK